MKKRVNGAVPRVTAAPRIHFGQPCVRNTRIPVYAVLELLSDGRSFEAIRRDAYPDLSDEDIRACIAYAASLVKSEEVYPARR